MRIQRGKPAGKKKAGADDAARDTKVARLISAGSDLAAGLTGTAVAIHQGGAGGAFDGVLAAVGVKQTTEMGLAELANRILSRRESARVGAVGILIRAGIEERLQRGELPRDDGFFAFQPGHRPKAQELLEGVLLKARDAYEEKKLPYIANICITTSFNSGIDPADAHLMLRYAEQITYRGFACLALCANATEYGLRDGYHGQHFEFSPQAEGVLVELLDLAQRSLIGHEGSPNYPANSPVPVEDRMPMAIEATGSIVPAKLVLDWLGHLMCDVLSLNDLPREDIEALVAQHLR